MKIVQIQECPNVKEVNTDIVLLDLKNLLTGVVI